MYYPRCVTHENSDCVVNLGLDRPNDGTWGVGRCPLELSHNIHMHYFMVRRVDMLW